MTSMKSIYLMFFLPILGSCKSIVSLDSSELTAATKATSEGKAPSDWSTNSELTSAPIVTQSCTENSCPSDQEYELGLEKEYWRHVHREDFAGMDAWLKKTKDYVTYSSDRLSRVKQIARLTKISAFGHGMMLLKHDFQELVPDLKTLLKAKDPARIAKDFPDEFKRVVRHPATSHLVAGLSSAVKANTLAPTDTNAQTLLLVLGSFAQATMPANIFGFKGLTGEQAYRNSLYGPSCRDISSNFQKDLFASRCYQHGLMGPSPESYKTCVDKESCEKVGTGTEGILSGAMSLVMLHGHDNAKQMLTMLGDGPSDDQIAHCNSYWCSFNNYNDPKAPLPEATAIAPFKKIGALLVIAEAYGKVGQLKKLDIALKSVREEAKRVNYPFMKMIDRVEASLKGGNRALGVPDILEIWNQPQSEKNLLGAVQFPLPISGRSGNCVSCHFGGVLSNKFQY